MDRQEEYDDIKRVARELAERSQRAYEVARGADRDDLDTVFNSIDEAAAIMERLVARERESPREAFFDDVIEPALLDIAERCEEQGLSMIAVVEYDRDRSGMTLTKRSGAGFAFTMIEAAAKAHGNLDAFMIWAERYGKEHGHQSAYLTMLEKMRS